MNLREFILDVLADSDESIIQIEQRCAYFKYNVERKTIILEIKYLLEGNFIEIAYPYDAEEIEDENIEDYWFRLTEQGQKEWEKIPDID